MEREKWLTSTEWVPASRLLDKWQISEAELFQLCQKDLPSYKRWDDCVFEMAHFKDLTKGLAEFSADYIDGAGNKFLNYSPASIEDVQDLFFVISDIEAYPLESCQTVTSNSDISENLFRNKGDFWEVHYQGESFSIKNLDRLHFIIFLLENPNTEFPVNELWAHVRGSNPDISDEFQHTHSDNLEKKGMSLVDLPIEKLYPKDKQGLENIAYEVWGRLKEAEDKGKDISKANDAWRSTKRHFLDGYGIMINETERGDITFVQKSKLNADTEKTRKNIGNQITTAIKDIKKFNQTLADHLTKNITKGAICSYINQRFEWKIIR